MAASETTARRGERVLLVDDEPLVLQGLRRGLRQYHLELAEGPEAGLRQIEGQRPFAVIVSDMQMPGMNGIEFLTRAQTLDPDAVRIMLTGNADQRTAVDAVNQGRIFRFLNKPCPPDQLSRAIDAALQQYRLVTAERELLTETLGGSISLMAELLSLINPTAFGRAGRVRTLARRACAALGVEQAWEIEVAAMLAHVGCVVVPEPTLAKYYEGRELSAEERRQLNARHEIAYDLVAKIPRLKGVAEIIRHARPDVGDACEAAERDDGPWGARILETLLDFDVLAARANQEQALRTLVARERHEPRVLDILPSLFDEELVLCELAIDGLEPGMLLDQPVQTNSGEVLIAKGTELTPSMIQRLVNFATTPRGVRQPLHVRCRVKEPTPAETLAAGYATRNVHNVPIPNASEVAG